jgi:hypothetical protein
MWCGANPREALLPLLRLPVALECRAGSCGTRGPGIA